jgi:glutamate synthase (NADPH/NADH) large chain
VKDGYNILILSDRNQSKDRMAIPALLATSATHQHLVREGLRTNTGLVVDTGSAREVHHFALLGGYGAEAICPWLAYESMHAMTNDHVLAHKNFIKSIGKGLYKVMSKMGISTYQSYCGAQIFEAVGLNSQLINAYFKGTPPILKVSVLKKLQKKLCVFINPLLELTQS